MKHHTFRTRHLQAVYALMGYKNNIECVNLSVEKPFHVRSQIHSSSLSVKNKITQCVSSALLLRVSLPKTGPLRFGSENQFPLNFAHEYILVQK